MNFLAHLLLAQPCGPSWIGNLMGDFMKGSRLEDLPDNVRKGVENHYEIDRFTDRHEAVRALRSEFSSPYKRCAGITIDIAFDHFLINNWNRYCRLELEDFLCKSYSGILSHQNLMNKSMERPVLMMIHHHWLTTYQSLPGVRMALERLSMRFPFANEIGNSYLELERLYGTIQKTFNVFFPKLIEHVRESAIEEPCDKQFLITA